MENFILDNHDNWTTSHHNQFQCFSNRTVSKKFNYCHGERVMVVSCMYVLNIFSKCQCFALLLQLKDNGV